MNNVAVMLGSGHERRDQDGCQPVAAVVNHAGRDAGK
jgi:hypothetical protein